MGTSRLDVKGEIQMERTMRVRVPKPRTGAEQPVVAKKAGNAAGAKRLDQAVTFIIQLDF